MDLAPQKASDLHQEAELAALRTEVERLRGQVRAWEAVFDLGRSELSEARAMIQAQEQVLDLSRAELKVLRTDVERLVNVDSALESRILELLARGAESESALLEAMEGLREKFGDDFCRDALRVMINLDHETGEAARLWEEMLAHRSSLRERLGRDPGVAVALIDYFKNFRGAIRSPKVIEVSVFADMLRHAVVDELTGLYNRRFLGRAVERDMARAAKFQLPLALVVGDVDHFKSINDTFGHPAGDQVLLGVARILLDNSRQEDAACRIGGEEFLLLAPDTNAESAFLLAEKARRAIESADFPVEKKVTMSFGVATFPEFGPTFESVLRAADGALYAAKEGGRNRTVLARP